MGESLGIWISLARLMRGRLHAETLLSMRHHGLMIHHWLLHGRRLVRVESHRLLVVHTHRLRLVGVISHMWLVVNRRRRLIRVISHGWLAVNRRWRLIRVKSHVRLWWVHRLILILLLSAFVFNVFSSNSTFKISLFILVPQIIPISSIRSNLIK